MESKWVCIVLLAVCSLAAGTARGDILVGANNDVAHTFGLGNTCSPGGCLNSGAAQPFILTQAVDATDLEVFVAGFKTPPGTFKIQLTDKIGSGTTNSDILAQGVESFPAVGNPVSAVDLALGGLLLSPGTYYVALTSDTTVSFACPPCTSVKVGQFAVDGTLVQTDGTVSSGFFSAFGVGNGHGPALTDFNPNGQPVVNHMDFLLEGQTAVPEPTSLLLLGTIVIALVGGLRRRSCNTQ